MLAELKSKSQVTIPSGVVSELGLKKGDLFEVAAEHGRVVLIPVVVYPREYVEKLEREAKSKDEKSEAFDDVDKLTRSLEEV